MNKEEINSVQYIENVTRDKTIKEMIVGQKQKLTTSIKIGAKIILYSKKWMIYLALAFINLLMFFLIDGIDVRYSHPDEAFIDLVFGTMFPFIFVFGCLLISLPISADEVSDHTMDMYLVRPIKRETYWLSRWIVVNIVVFCVNVVIYLIYFLYFHAFAKQGVFAGIGDNLGVFGSVVLLILPATFIYSGLFLLVGMIGNRGFLLSLLVALFELLFVSLLFLNNSPLIPQTNLYRIANELLPKLVDFHTPKDLTFLNAELYTIIFTTVVFFLGAFYLRIREIK